MKSVPIGVIPKRIISDGDIYKRDKWKLTVYQMEYCTKGLNGD